MKNVKIWNKGIDFDNETINQIHNISEMKFIYPHVAVMPDAHLGKGATVGTVIGTDKAIIPAAVGVDIGCGMQALKTNLKLSEKKKKHPCLVSYEKLKKKDKVKDILFLTIVRTMSLLFEEELNHE
jgi:RNA-splicing ligase RtcB